MEYSKEERKIVLVADDDADDCLLIKDALIDSGLDWDIQFVGDGIELMEYLENCARREEQGDGRFPDMILLDLNMPRKGGREALKEISVHTRFNKIPIVILTTSDEPQDVALCSSLGAKLFITKPNMYNEWLERVAALKEFV
ncbi:Response regulator receiver protein [Syntrophobacter sp. SbD1]|nr:Response regulator receiver protein [Syntrophobacter sp. SbD1]